MSVTALVRNQSQADIFATKGVGAVLFKDINDSADLRRIAAEYDIVIHNANSFHPASAVALIEGLANRKAATGQDTYFIQSTGTSNVGDHPFSKRFADSESKIFSDRDGIYDYMVMRENLEAWAQRTADLAIVEAGEKTGVKTYLVQSSLVYGLRDGLFHLQSVQVPLLIRRALAVGYPEVIGDGAGLWDHLHIDDLTSLFDVIVGKIVDGADIPEGRRGIYFAGTGHHTWMDIANHIGKAGIELGVLKSAAVKHLTLEEAAEQWLGGKEKAQFAELGLGSRYVSLVHPRFPFPLLSILCTDESNLPDSFY